MGKKFKHLSKEDWEYIRGFITQKRFTIQQMADKFSIDRHSIYVHGWKEGWLKKKKDRGIVNKLKKLFE